MLHAPQHVGDNTGETTIDYRPGWPTKNARPILQGGHMIYIFWPRHVKTHLVVQLLEVGLDEGHRVLDGLHLRSLLLSDLDLKHQSSNRG